MGAIVGGSAKDGSLSMCAVRVDETPAYRASREETKGSTRLGAVAA